MSTTNSIASSGWIDISVPLQEGIVVYPNEDQFRIERRCDMERGDKSNNSSIHMGVHTATHMDAPRHGIAKGKSIDQMPLDAAIGLARVIEITDTEAIKPEELRKYKIQPGERILFKTLNSERCWQSDSYVSDAVYINGDAARLLADCGARLVGIDYLSVGGGTAFQQAETHDVLLGAGIWLLEGLDLSGVSAGDYNLICLPLRLVQAEGSPVRAVVQPIA